MREQAGGRLWAAVLTATFLFVASDFVRHPFTEGSVGRAAVPASDIGLLVPAFDSNRTAQTLARSLSGPQRQARVMTTRSGAAVTVLAFARRDERDGQRLLVLTSAMLAEIQRGRRQPISGEERSEAEAALRALERLRPVAPLVADDEVVAVRSRGGPRSLAALRTGLRTRPGARVFGIGADAASKARLAGLLHRTKVAGEVPYRVLPSGADAVLALSSDDVDVVLASRSQTLAERRRSGVKLLPGSSGRSWSLVVGPPALDDGVRRALAGHIAAAKRRPPWLAYVRSERLRPLRPGRGGLHRFLERERLAADRLASIAARVPERGRDGE